MKRLIFALCAVFAAFCLSAQVVVRTSDNTLYILPISAIDSITFESETQSIGRFSVGADKYVGFAPGNLQCWGVQSGQYRWGFASEQYAFLGAANITKDASGKVVLSDTIDLFGWSGSTGSAKWGISTSGNASDYAGDFVDWGQNIGNGTTWRTLTKDEWYYLLVTRANAARLFALGNIAGEKGVILLPDAWAGLPDVSFTPSVDKGLVWYADYGMYYDTGTSGTTHFGDNSYSVAEWSSLERAGAVFLPCAGTTDEGVISVNEAAQYWMTEPYEGNPKSAYTLLVAVNAIALESSANKYNRNPVRLVTEVP